MRTIPAFCNNVLLFALIPSGFAQTTLQQYLILTPQQVTAIKNLNGTNSAYVGNKQARANIVNQELQTIYATPPPDPAQLGPRYVELEAIRRDIVTASSTLQQQATAQLTPAQLSLIQALNTAAELQPLTNDAQCAFLLDRPSFTFTSYATTSGGALFPAYTGVFSFCDPSACSPSILFPGIPSGLTVPYIPPAPTATFCGANNFPISVREYLNLADAQVSAITAASASYNDANLRAQNQVSDLQVQIRDQTAAPTPDPAALGPSYAQLSAIGQQMQTQGVQLRQTARAILSDQQSTQLKMLQNAVTLQPLVTQAMQCGLLTQPPGIQSILLNPFFGREGCSL